MDHYKAEGPIRSRRRDKAGTNTSCHLPTVRHPDRHNSSSSCVYVLSFLQAVYCEIPSAASIHLMGSSHAGSLPVRCQRGKFINLLLSERPVAQEGSVHQNPVDPKIQQMGCSHAVSQPVRNQRVHTPGQHQALTGARWPQSHAGGGMQSPGHPL
jgi:hypothetical protein